MNKNFNFELEPGRELNKIEYTGKDVAVSIITPTYNTKDLTLQTVNCILNQTYPYFEWLIVDDGSKDKESLELLKKIEKMDSRIKVLHKENGGPAVARDYGVEKSSKDSEYILFIDDDDLLDKTFIEMAYFTMRTNKEAAWCYCDVVNFDGYNSLWNKSFSSETMKKDNLLVNSALIKKDAYNEVNGFHLDGKGLYEDWILWLKLLAKGHYPIHMSYYGFWYRKKKDSGEFNSAQQNHKDNMELVKKYAEEVKIKVDPIEFPREVYNWEGVTDRVDLVEPKYKNNKKTNILVIVPWMTLGGADKFNLDLFKMIDRNKFSITLVSTQPTEYVWRQQFEEACDYVFDLSTFIDCKDWTAFINYLIETRNIDIIFNTNSTTGYEMLPYLHAKYPTIPIMDYIHMEEWYNRCGGYSRDSAAVSNFIDRTLFCNGGSERIMNEYFGIDKKKLGTVYIGVDADKFDPKKYDVPALKEKYELKDNQFVIGLIARIDLQKRPYLLMRIIEETVKEGTIENPLFLIAGDGPLLPNIKSIADNKGLNDYVTFLGMSKTPDEIYAVSDVTLNCSIKEGLALTAYESLSMGIPVVSADVGGQKELINDKTGVIVPCLQDETEISNFNYSDEEVLNYVNGLVKVYKDIDNYKKACRKRILDGFTINHMVENMTKEFESLIKLKKVDDGSIKNIELYKELLNQYFVGNKPLYSWLVSEYNRKIYGQPPRERFLIVKKSLRKTKQKLRDKLWRIPLWRKMVLSIKKH